MAFALYTSDGQPGLVRLSPHALPVRCSPVLFNLSSLPTISADTTFRKRVINWGAVSFL